jgi:hypothetical protein
MCRCTYYKGNTVLLVFKELWPMHLWVFFNAKWFVFASTSP